MDEKLAATRRHMRFLLCWGLANCVLSGVAMARGERGRYLHEYNVLWNLLRALLSELRPSERLRRYGISMWLQGLVHVTNSALWLRALSGSGASDAGGDGSERA